MRTGARRLLPAIGIGLLVALIVALLAAPLGIAFLASGVDWVSTAAGQWHPAGPLPAGLKLFVGLYSLALVIVVLLGMARLLQIGRASCRARVCPYGSISGASVSQKKK